MTEGIEKRFAPNLNTLLVVTILVNKEQNNVNVTLGVTKKSVVLTEV